MGKRLKGNSKNSKSDIIKMVVFVALIAIMLIVTIYLLPWIISLKDEAGREALREYIYSNGVGGVFILLGIQVLQVVVAVIPGEPIEVISGLLYGTLGGYLICTIGVVIGTAIIFYGVRLLGYSFISNLLGESRLTKFKFLQDEKRLEVVTFLLFFIPGTPKDILTYFMPFTKIKASAFFIIATVARIPSIISSTFAGASIGDGKWIQTIVIFCAIGVVGILGIILNDRIMKKANAAKKAVKDNLNKISGGHDAEK